MLIIIITLKHKVDIYLKIKKTYKKIIFNKFLQIKLINLQLLLVSKIKNLYFNNFMNNIEEILLKVKVQ